MPIKIIFSDLDRTLLPHNSVISKPDLAALQKLGEAKIPRVIATGRSLFSAYKVLPKDFPIDYLIFSTGAGIMDWQSKQILKAAHLNWDDAQKILAVLLEHQFSFMMHLPIPENHCFNYSNGQQPPVDFIRRLKIYQDYATPLKENNFAPSPVTQFVTVLNKGDERLSIIYQKLDQYKIIRTTSPLDHQSHWIEIFPADVSKGHAAQWLCNKLRIDSSEVIALGNDYNDLDLLDWAGKSYVVGDSPRDLQGRYLTAKNHDDHAFSYLVMKEIFNIEQAE